MEDKNNTFNVCSHLVESNDKIKEFLENHKDVPTLKLIFTKQLELQTYLETTKEDWYLPSFDSKVGKSNLEKLTLIRFCKLHFDREYFELEDSLGGMSRGLKEASSIAKPWKAKHMELMEFKFNDLSEEDKNEVKMEFIDMFHFLAMMGLALGYNSEIIHDTLMSMDVDYTFTKDQNDVIGNIYSFYSDLDLMTNFTCGQFLEGNQLTKFDIDSSFTLLEQQVIKGDSDSLSTFIEILMCFLNIGFILGLSSDDIKYLYTQKNLENFDRQERGY